MAEEPRIKALNAAGDGLKELRRPWDALFKDAAQFFSAHQARFDRPGNAFRQPTKTSRILNPRGRLALRTLQNGMQTGVTSPARPWFRLLPRDRNLRNDDTVKRHLFQAQNEIHQLFQRGGVYDMLHTGWGHLGLFGHDCGILEDDVERDLHGQQLIPGEFWLGVNSYGMIDTVYREFSLTVQQMVHKFVYRGDLSAAPDWGAVTDVVKRDWTNGRHGAPHRVNHLIAPRYNRDPRSALPKDKPIMSVYWQPERKDRLALDSGYDVSPIVASRWDVEGHEIYGNSPAFDALPIVKRLQTKERDLAEAERRLIRPPINAPAEWRNSAFSFDPEAVNFVADPSRGAVPAFQVDPPIAEMRAQIRELEEDIDDTMYASLFLMIANLDRRQITAREIDERHEEKLIELGPVLERQHREKLGPLLSRAYDIVVDKGLVEPLPEQYDGLELGIDYTSMLAQAQKALSTGAIERTAAFVGNLSGANSEVLDKLDMDAAVDEYAEAVGAPASVIRPESAVAELRQKRAAAQQQAEQLAAAGQVAQTAKAGAEAAQTLAATDTVTGQGPRDILRQLGIG